MTIRPFIWLGAATVAVAAGIVGYVAHHRMPASNEIVEPGMPPGVTLQAVGTGQGYRQEIRPSVALREEGITLADAKGMTLYTYDRDTEPGKSVCTDACATVWPPLGPLPGAKPIGAWSIIDRGDGTKQWAYKGKPLYRFSQDEDIGSVGGLSPRPKELDRNGFTVQPKGKGVPRNWHAALIYPARDAVLPEGIAINEVADAAGLVLVDDHKMTLYTFGGDPNRDSMACAAPPCTSDWSPVVAPQLSEPVGDFSTIARHDGIQQWTYKGKALYRYVGDYAPGDVHGADVNPAYRVAQVVRYFMPPNVAMGQTLRHATVLTTATGMTLYRRDGYAWQASSGHQLRHGVPMRPAVGRDIGTKGCDADCLKTWHPFKAAADAQSSGYWSVLTREDGSKQWAYQDFALYTYDGDRKPGDSTGNDIYDVTFSDDPNQNNFLLTPTPGTSSLYWIIAEP